MELSNKIETNRIKTNKIQLRISAPKKVAAGAKTKVGKAGPIVEKITIPVEKDVNKLVNYVCGSNIYNEGEDIKVGSISNDLAENALNF